MGSWLEGLEGGDPIPASRSLSALRHTPLDPTFLPKPSSLTPLIFLAILPAFPRPGSARAAPTDEASPAPTWVERFFQTTPVPNAARQLSIGTAGNAQREKHDP